MAAEERERLESTLTRRWLDLRDHLDERSRRLWLAAEARSLGYGGTQFVAAVTKVAKDTISDGIRELAGETAPGRRVRRAGAGRKRIEEVDPGLPAALDALVEPVTRGDPESPLRWTAKSLNTLAGELTAQGHPVSDDTVRRLLTEQGFRSPDQPRGHHQHHRGDYHPHRPEGQGPARPGHLPQGREDHRPANAGTGEDPPHPQPLARRMELQPPPAYHTR